VPAERAKVLNAIADAIDAHASSTSTADPALSRPGRWLPG